MHRIDSVNARPDQNGTGKQGFNDNTDLSGQDATYMTPEWCNAVQEEIATVVEDHQPLEKGNNGQLKAALYAIFATNDALEEVDTRLSAAVVALASTLQQAIIDDRNTQFDKQYPIGTGTIFNLDSRNPNTYLGRGVWEAFGGGTHLSLAGTSDGVTLVGGAISGSHTHGITVDELPNFRLKNGVADEAAGPSDTSCHVYGSTTDDMPSLATSGVQNAGGQTAYQGYTSAIGGDQAMPIRPRTTTIYGWLRTG
jgi:hypothetical protein